MAQMTLGEIMAGKGMDPTHPDWKKVSTREQAKLNIANGKAPATSITNAKPKENKIANSLAKRKQSASEDMLDKYESGNLNKNKTNLSASIREDGVGLGLTKTLLSGFGF